MYPLHCQKVGFIKYGSLIVNTSYVHNIVYFLFFKIKIVDVHAKKIVASKKIIYVIN